MAKIREIKAQNRHDQGKGASRRLRRAGFVPAIVYGAEQAPQSIQIEHNTVLLSAKHEWFFSSVLNLNIDGHVQKALVRDWQKHPYKLQMLHLDFQRVDENVAIRISVPLHFLNQEKSPAAKTSGVVISHNMTEVEVSCLPKDLPEFIEFDLADLKPGDIIHLSQLTLPAGVEIPSLNQGVDYDVAIVTANTVKEEVEEAPATPTEGEAAPAAGATPAPAAETPPKK